MKWTSGEIEIWDFLREMPRYEEVYFNFCIYIHMSDFMYGYDILINHVESMLVYL